LNLADYILNDELEACGIKRSWLSEEFFPEGLREITEISTELLTPGPRIEASSVPTTTLQCSAMASIVGNSVSLEVLYRRSNSRKCVFPAVTFERQANILKEKFTRFMCLPIKSNLASFQVDLV
jgi:hypothetical protein